MSQPPRADRPEMPGGYLEEKRLPWAWAEQRLVAARNYWVTTVTAAGAPHARPVWGVWLDGAFWFSTGSRIRTHLARDARVSVNLESGDECVIVEGSARLVEDVARARPVAAAYDEKYAWDYEPAAGEFFEVRPQVGFGWLCDASGLDGGALFSQTATRWRFDAGP